MRHSMDGIVHELLPLTQAPSKNEQAAIQGSYGDRGYRAALSSASCARQLLTIWLRGSKLLLQPCSYLIMAQTAAFQGPTLEQPGAALFQTRPLPQTHHPLLPSPKSGCMRPQA